MIFPLAVLAFLFSSPFGEIRTLQSLEEKQGATYWALVPGQWSEALRPLLAHRVREGLSVAILPVELFAQEDKLGQAESIHRFFREGWTRWKVKPQFLLLAAGPQAQGILPFVRDWTREDVKALETLSEKSYRAVASDAPFALMDEDDLPDLAVGRLPARTKDELVAMAEKILTYENEGPGLWRRRILLLGGLFGEPRVDAVVEAAVSGLLDREIPYDFDLQLLRAQENSPFSVGVAKTRAFFRQQMEEGALLAIYAGHANPGNFSTPVIGRKQWEDLFTLEEARSMHVRRGAPVLLSFACYAGGLALNQETLADSALRNPNGPVAYFGACGVSVPMPDLLLAHEMTRSFRENPQWRLGELVRGAKRAAVENREDPFHRQVQAGAGLFGFSEEKQANLLRFELWIYNLHGDPALRLQRPQATVTLSYRLNETGLQVEGVLDGVEKSAGDALVSLELPRATPAPQGASWKEANDKALIRRGVQIHEGRFQVQLDLGGSPPPGIYYLKAYATSENKDGSGCLRIEIPH